MDMAGNIASNIADSVILLVFNIAINIAGNIAGNIFSNKCLANQCQTLHLKIAGEKEKDYLKTI